MISFIRHLFVPHHSNNHRPKLLHHKSLFILILVIITLASWIHIVRQAAPSVLGIATDISVERLLSFTNQKRQDEGVPALVMNSELTQAASAKAANMFAKDYWAHNAPDGTTPWVFVQASGYNYIYAGENLAKDFNDSPGVVDAWMASPSHRENMLSNKYDEVGFAVVNGTLNGQETTLVVEMLGKRRVSQVAKAPAPQRVILPRPTVVSPGLQTGEPAATPILSLTPPTTPPPSGGPTSPPTPPQSFVAGIASSPLIDSALLTKRASLFILAIMMIAFIADVVYIERRKLVRLVGHNADHILFLAGSFLVILFILGKGVIL